MIWNTRRQVAYIALAQGSKPASLSYATCFFHFFGEMG